MSKDFWGDPLVRLVIAYEERKALAAAARERGDVKQAPAESPQSGGEAVTPKHRHRRQTSE